MPPVAPGEGHCAGKQNISLGWGRAACLHCRAAEHQRRLSHGSEPRPCFLPALLNCFPLSRLFHVLLSAFFMPRVSWQQPGSRIPLPWRNSHQDKGSVGAVCALVQRCAHTEQLLPFSGHLLSGTVGVNILKAILYPANDSTGSTSTHFPPTGHGTWSQKC